MIHYPEEAGYKFPNNESFYIKHGIRYTYSEETGEWEEEGSDDEDGPDHYSRDEDFHKPNWH